MRWTTVCSRALGVALLIWALLLAAAVAADEQPTPTPTPTPTPAPETEDVSDEAATLGEVAATQPPRTLSDLARERQLKREGAEGTQQQGEAGVVIDNEALAKYSDQGALTSSKGGSGRGSGRSGSRAGAARGESEGSGQGTREYWRARYRKQLEKVATLKAQLEALDSEIPALWNDFYSRDDPAYRDGVIKPKLDRKIEEREALLQRIPEEEAQLPEILDEARRDGALPGWFRGLE